MSLKIDISFPGGNIFIEDINGFDVTLTKDMRNTNATGITGRSAAHSMKSEPIISPLPTAGLAAHAVRRSAMMTV